MLNGSGGWAVCNGPGRLNVAGYLLEVSGGGCAIKNDPLHRRFLDQQSAAATVLGKPVHEELRYYSLKRGGEFGIVLTHPDVLKRILDDGWILVASAATLDDLEKP
jgi:hypothetical protein